MRRRLRPARPTSRPAQPPATTCFLSRACSAPWSSPNLVFRRRQRCPHPRVGRAAPVPFTPKCIPRIDFEKWPFLPSHTAGVKHSTGFVAGFAPRGEATHSIYCAPCGAVRATCEHGPVTRRSPSTIHRSARPWSERQAVRSAYTYGLHRDNKIVTTNLKDELASLRIDKSARGGGGRGALIVVVILLLAVVAGVIDWTRREPVMRNQNC